MADKNLVMTFLNEEGARTSITLSSVREDLTNSEVSDAMDIVIAKNIFYSSGGNLAAKHGAQVTERNVTMLDVK